MKCPSCGFENESGVRFCGECGKPMDSPREAGGNKTCPKCGQENPPEAHFCQNCGINMTTYAAKLTTPPQIEISTKPKRHLASNPTPPPPVKKTSRSWLWVVTVLIVIALLGSTIFLFQRTAKNVLPTNSAPPTNSTLPTVVNTIPPASTSEASNGSDEAILLYDDFKDETSGWPVFGDENGEVKYSGGNLSIVFYDLMGFHAAWSPEEYTDFIVETMFSTPASVSDVGAGFTLRTTEKRWYLLWIYPAQGKYIFQKDINENVTELIPLTASPIIQPSEKAGRYYVNLKVEARGDQFDIWVGNPDLDYEHLATVSDPDLETGHLGPSADCPDQPFSQPVDVLFSWIRISK